jgi:hypothetical protein
MRNPFDARFVGRLSENAHLLRYPHPSSLRRTSLYASFLGISEALHMDIFHQPLRSRFFERLHRYERGTRTVKVVPTPGSL